MLQFLPPSPTSPPSLHSHSSKAPHFVRNKVFVWLLEGRSRACTLGVFVGALITEQSDLTLYSIMEARWGFPIIGESSLNQPFAL